MTKHKPILPILFYRLVKENSTPKEWKKIRQDKILKPLLGKSYNIPRMLERLYVEYKAVYYKVEPLVSWVIPTSFPYYLDFRETIEYFNELKDFCSQYEITWNGGNKFEAGRVFDPNYVTGEPQSILIRNSLSLLYSCEIDIHRQLLSANEWMSKIEDELKKLDQNAHKIIRRIT